MATTLPDSTVAARPATALLPEPAMPQVMQRPTAWTRLRAWTRLAYTDIGSKEHNTLLEWIIWLVIVSVVITVLQHDQGIDAQYHQLFVVVEIGVFFLFTADYLLNLLYAPNRRKYALSFSGIVDLMAILPSLLVLVDFSSVKFLRGLRFLRFLRILQVVKAVQQRQMAQGSDERESLLLDLQLGVIALSALLLLVPDDGVRNLLLLFTLAVAITTGLRRWLIYRQQLTLSVVVLVLSVMAAGYFAVMLDGLGESVKAAALLCGASAVALVTWLQIESPAGAL